MNVKQKQDEAEQALAPDVPARQIWSRCMRRSDPGESYLASRGLDVAELLRRQIVRFNPGSGAPSIMLRDLAIGDAILNVVKRNLPRTVLRGFPKALGLTGATTLGALVGNVDELKQGQDAIACEGVIDTITACLAWPGAIVFGAHGGLRLPAVTAEVASRVRKLRGRLFLAVHADKVGEEKGTEAGKLALQAGLRLDSDFFVVDHGDAKDLNEAWQRGWRP